ncbi:hypothetical protein C0989_002606 [Termitomyces sp. Mn162]|nr:hypothetical protein C0989_002606 [Termitomyces sp. Mn162]
MSFCRPLLLPFHAPKVPRKYLATCSVHAFPNASGRINTGKHPFGGLHTRANTLLTTSTPVAHPTIHISKRVEPTTNIPDTAESTTNNWNNAESTTNNNPDNHVEDNKLTLAEYDEQRARDPKSVSTLSVSTYLKTFFSAAKLDKLDLAESVVSDILDVYEGTDESRCTMLVVILEKGLSFLKRETVLRMLQYLNETSVSRFDTLITRIDGNIARRMISGPTIFDTDRPFLRLFYPALLQRLETIRNPKFYKGGVFVPPGIIYAAFAAIQKLLSMSFTEYALNIFQALTQIGYIPSDALRDVENSSDNPSLIMAMAVIRSCLSWKFYALAASIMTETIIANPTNQSIINLNIDIIHSLLSTKDPSPRAVSTSGHLIRRIHPHSPVPDSVIRLFYETAVVADAKEEAEVLYAFTRQDRVDHQYAPPHNAALPWLMDHFATTSSRTHLARTLAREAVENELLIPILYRARFIARTAALGYATQARILWERHAVGKDRAAVVGNSALMIRMVSLFWKMHKTYLEKATESEAQKEPRERIEKFKKVSEEAADLAERVRTAFGDHHAPLEKAQHFHLTSFARACFIVGKLPEGYQAFSHLLSRREYPDLYDCNVALSAISQVNPALGEKMIRQMIAIGLRPDGVSYGTALHYAVLQGNRKVVDSMLDHIRALDDKEVSSTTLASLIRVTLTLEEKGSLEELRHMLGKIMDMMDMFPEVSLAHTYLGKKLVYTAIRAKDGVLAYNFWKRLLKKAAQWDDWEQQSLRHGIATLIREPSFALPKYRNAMLLQLGQRKRKWRSEEDAPTA